MNTIKKYAYIYSIVLSNLFFFIKPVIVIDISSTSLPDYIIRHGINYFSNMTFFNNTEHDKVCEIKNIR